MPKLISQKNFQNLSTSTLTTTSTNQVALDVFDADQFRSARYQIQASSGTSHILQSSSLSIMEQLLTTQNML